MKLEKYLTEESDLAIDKNLIKIYKQTLKKFKLKSFKDIKDDYKEVFSYLEKQLKRK